MKGPRSAVCQHNQDNSYEFRLKINTEHYTWISYDDFKSFLLTDFMPVVRQKLDEMNVPPKEEVHG